METGSKISKLVIGARDLKGRLGTYLLQGLIVSVFMHGTIMAIVGLWPRSTSPLVHDAVIKVSDFGPVIWDKVPPLPERPKLRPPEKPEIDRIVPVENEPLEPETELKPEQDYPALSGTGPVDGTSDSGSVGGSGSGDIDSSEDIAGANPPWDPKFSVFEVPPVALLDINPQPAYPRLAQRAGTCGQVFIWVLVSDKGNVLKWEIVDVNPPGLGFEDEVARVIPLWKFTPALQQNRPVSVWVAIPFKFKVSN